MTYVRLPLDVDVASRTPKNHPERFGPVPDVEYADEDEAGQLALGVPGEQRAIPTLGRVVDIEDRLADFEAQIAAIGRDPMAGRVNYDPNRGA